MFDRRIIKNSVFWLHGEFCFGVKAWFGNKEGDLLDGWWASLGRRGRRKDPIKK